MKLPDDAHKVEFERALELVKEKIIKDEERTLQRFTYNEKE